MRFETQLAMSVELLAERRSGLMFGAWLQRSQLLWVALLVAFPPAAVVLPQSSSFRPDLLRRR